MGETAVETVDQVLRGLADDLTQAAQVYLGRYGKWLELERGGVPLELAAVLGAAHEGQNGWFWYLPPALSRRLEIPRVLEDGRVPSKLQLWAGLRVANEAAAHLERTYPKATAGASGSELWTAACQLELLGPRVFSQAARLAEGPLELLELVQRGAAEGQLAERIVLGALRVRAAEQLRGGPLPREKTELRPAPDDRVRQSVAKGLGAAGIGLQAYKVALAGGWLNVPGWFDRADGAGD